MAGASEEDTNSGGRLNNRLGTGSNLLDFHLDCSVAVPGQGFTPTFEKNSLWGNSFKSFLCKACDVSSFI